MAHESAQEHADLQREYQRVLQDYQDTLASNDRLDSELRGMQIALQAEREIERSIAAAALETIAANSEKAKRKRKRQKEPPKRNKRKHGSVWP